MITMKIAGVNPIEEVITRCLFRNLPKGERIEAVTRDGRDSWIYVWLGDTVRYITKGE